LKRFLLIALLLLPLMTEAQTLLRLPAEKLGKPVLFGSRIADVNRPRGKVFAPGQRNPQSVLMHFELTPDSLVMLVPAGPRPGKKARGLQKRVHPVRFPLVEVTGDTLVFDVTEYFSEYPHQISAIPPKELEKEIEVSYALSTLESSDYLQVTGNYRYASGLEVTAVCYLLFLPENPMPGKNLQGYNGDDFSHRWDLSRQPEITFYVDKAFPQEWYPYIKEGLEDWNKAFEAIGLGSPVSVLPEPDGLDRYSPLVNMVRYMDVEEANAKGDVLVDPRSGEVLQGDILWWKNVKQLIMDWRYVQTGAAEPAARLQDYPMDILGPMIRYSVCHEMGHVLGLNHNMGGSWSYPSDSLRSPSFTQKYGTTASVMDYARYNHLATSADIAKGVSLLPPRLGPYDYYAIGLGYAAEAPEAGEYCYYAPFSSAAISPDPSAQAETLGNDLLASSAAGLRNCRALLALDGMDEHRQEFVRKQYYRYLWLCLSNIGGSVQGVPVKEKEQTRTLKFVLQNLSSVPEDLYDAFQEKRILDELDGNFLPVRIRETLGDKALNRYRSRLKRQLKKYGYNN
jgi:hypothetical protein